MRMRTLAIMVLALTAAPAWAQCDPAQMEGHWTLIGSNNGAWTRCELTVDAEGAYEGRCRGTGRPRRGAPVDGVIELADDCAFTGTLAAGGPPQVIDGVIDEGGAVGSGLTHFGTRRQNFGLLFTLTKRPAE